MNDLAGSRSELANHPSKFEANAVSLLVRVTLLLALSLAVSAFGSVAHRPCLMIMSERKTRHLDYPRRV